MHTISSIAIPAHSTVSMVPDGCHMLITGAGPIRGGKDITLTLVFAHARPGPGGRAGHHPSTGGAPTSSTERRTVLVMSSYRQPGTVLTDHTFTVPLDHDEPGGERSRCSPARWSRPARPRPTCPGWCSSRAGPGSAAPRPAGRAAWLGPGARRLPGAAARPARHRPLHPGQPADAGRARHRAAAGRLPAHCSGPTRSSRDAELIRRAGHRRRAVERARPELRRLLHGDLPVPGAGGAPRGVHHRRPARPGRHAPTTSTGPPTEGGAARTRRTTSATRWTWTRPAGSPGSWPASDVRAARRRAAHRGGVPDPRPDAGREHRQRTTCTTCSRTPFAGGGLSDDFLHGVRRTAQLRRRPAVRGAARGRATRRARPTRWSAQRIRAEFAEFDPAAAAGRRRAAAVHRRDDLPVDVRGRPGAAPAARGGGRPGASGDWPRALRRGPAGGERGARSRPRSTTTTCTCRREISLPTARGDPRPAAWVTNEYEHDGLRTSNGAVLDRLLALARGPTRAPPRPRRRQPGRAGPARRLRL